MKEKEKEQFQKQAQEELFKAQKKFQEEKRIYNEAVRKHYKTLNEIEANFPEENNVLALLIKKTLTMHNISDFVIEKYDDIKIYNHIISNSENYYGMANCPKEGANLLNPNNLTKLAAILSVNENNYLFKTMVKNIKKPDYIHKIIKPIIKDTYGAIVFEEQAKEIINLILDANENEIDMFYKSLYKTYKMKKYLEKLDCSTSLIDYIKQNYCEIYILQYKAPYFAFITSSVEKGIKENKAHKLFDLLLAYFIDYRKYYKKEKELHACQRYKLAFIDVNYLDKNKVKKDEK